MIKAIIFDCFGVLLEDSLKKHMDELRVTNPIQAQGLTDILHASHRGILSAEDTRAQMLAGLGMTQSQYTEWLGEPEARNAPLFEYILQLRKQGYKTAVLSNISIGGLKRRFTDIELEQYFDTVVASGDVGYAKPDPQIYELAAERLGVRFDECVFTDDREEFCEAAQAVGMQAIVFVNFEQFKTDLEELL